MNIKTPSVSDLAKPLTDPQAEVLRFIKEYRSETGTSPSYREIQKHFRYKSVKAVQDHVQALFNKGALEKVSSKKSKGLARQLMPAGEKVEGVKRISVYGEVAAGGPREGVQLELGSLFVNEAISKNECFGLRVTGNSMVDAGIYEGDFLIVEKSARARNGEIVVALLDGETTVKRYQDQKGQVHLIPENAEMTPIPVQGKKLEIQGKVIGLQRKF